MRTLPVLLTGGLLLLSGCFDYEGVELTFSAHAPRNQLHAELRATGLHRDAVEGCRTVEACRTQLLRLACADPPEHAVSDWSGTIEVMEDGQLDRVSRWDQALDVGVLGTDASGFQGIQALRAGRTPRPKPTFGFLDTNLDLQAEVLRGRFEVVTLGLDPDAPAHLFVMQSRRGTIRFSAMIQDEPAAPAALQWAASVPGLVDALTADPVRCSLEQAQAMEP